MTITILQIFLIFVILTCSSFFSAGETAITAASRAKLHQLAKEGNKRAQVIKMLQEKVGLVISTFLMGNTMLNALSTSLATGLLIDLLGSEGIAGELYATLIMGTILILYVEVLPKIYAVQYPEKILLKTAHIFKFLFILFRPLTITVNWLAHKTLRFFGVQSRMDIHHQSTVEELRGAIDLHHGPGQDVAHERQMLKSILDLGEVEVGEIMVHRKHIRMINADESANKIVDQVLSSPFTRLPLWKDDPDNIIGIIHAKALLRAVRQHQEPLETLDILKIATPPWFVPESTDLLDQLHAFRARREHFAIVVDEYGSLMGIVTLEDILEEIVGDIVDEHDVAVKGVRPQTDGSYIVDGDVTIRDLNRQFDWDLPDEAASTVAGLVIHAVRLIPEVGQVFILHNFRFEILRRQRNQVTLLKVIPPSH